jgi:hypothetical protein
MSIDDKNTDSLISRINNLRTITIRNKGRYDELEKAEEKLLIELQEEFKVKNIKEAEDLLKTKYERIEKYKKQLEVSEQRLLKLMK